MPPVDRRKKPTTLRCLWCSWVNQTVPSPGPTVFNASVAAQDDLDTNCVYFYYEDRESNSWKSVNVASCSVQQQHERVDNKNYFIHFFLNICFPERKPRWGMQEKQQWEPWPCGQHRPLLSTTSDGCCCIIRHKSFIKDRAQQKPPVGTNGVFTKAGAGGKNTVDETGITVCFLNC